MARYLLSSHSYLCIAEDHAVFLDLKRDRYTALSPEHAFALQNLVRGWPTSASDSAALRNSNADPETVAKTLVAEGLLTENVCLGKPATPASLDAPNATFWWDYVWPQLERRDMVNFISAWLTVTTLMRCIPLERIVHRVHRRKVRILQSSTQFDLARARRITLNYLVLQPVFFSAYNACLRNSLTCLEFLARYDLYPTWVFGVRMKPWGAHSWLQSGTTVLNDTIENVRDYTPILTI